MTYFTREEWGARPYLTGGNKVTHGPIGVAIHYNGLPLSIGPVCECDKLVRGIQNYHMDTKGWKDIAYDVVACPHGNTYQGRIGTTNGTGANGTSVANANYMAVMGLIGDGETPTPQLYEAIKSGIKICQAVGAGDIITGHREFAETPCPGTALWTWIQSGLTGEDVTVSEKLTSMLAYGSKGTGVTLLQNMLNGLIEAGLTVDGSFGTATENKVKEYQAAYGFDADGIVGPITRAQLNADWAEHNAYKPPGNAGEEPEPPIEEPVEPPVEPELPIEEPEPPVEEPKVADLTVAELEALLDGLAFKVAHEVLDIFKAKIWSLTGLTPPGR